MNKILSIDAAVVLSKTFQKQRKNLVLAGGCFDILHPGHIQFLRRAKAAGDLLALLLESDESIKKRKGDTRPINMQQKRAETLLAKTDTDIVALLPYPFDDKDYDNLVTRLKPAIIATTLADPYKYHKDRQASLIGAKVLEVIERLPEYSTTQLLIKKNE